MVIVCVCILSTLLKWSVDSYIITAGTGFVEFMALSGWKTNFFASFVLFHLNEPTLYHCTDSSGSQEIVGHIITIFFSNQCFDRTWKTWRRRKRPWITNCERWVWTLRPAPPTSPPRQRCASSTRFRVRTACWACAIVQWPLRVSAVTWTRRCLLASTRRETRRETQSGFGPAAPLRTRTMAS